MEQTRIECIEYLHSRFYVRVDIEAGCESIAQGHH